MIHREAPLGVLPLYVRAGSVLPMGPEEEYTDQDPGAPIEVRIYPGHDGDANLYFDDGLTYEYEKGRYTWVPMHWNDASRTFTVGAADGQFPIFPRGLEFRVILVGSRHGAGEVATSGDRRLMYSGTPVHTHL